MKQHLLIIACLCACKAKARQPADPHSFADPDRVSVKALTLELSVDFTKKTLSGTARLDLTRTDRDAPLVLDDDGLVIEGVTDCHGAKLNHRVGKKLAIGAPLTVTLGSGDCVELAYHTTPEAGALLWVEPSGTAGGKHPMLFTQSQATRARTWIPLQDSPAVRFTYSATIHAPAGMWAIMSGENARELQPSGTWHITQPHAIPSYLMALAVGDFAFQAIGPRSGVYAEPSVAPAAAQEFAEVEAMMAAAEKLYGPYRWGRYDMLVLPPSFPFGGMENPNLTFLTPTVISGDRALVSLIAHELAHSWSGNLATNKTWNDTWLNEGVTTYVEHRIMEQLRGAEVASVDWFIGRKDIDEAIAKRGKTQATALAHNYDRSLPPDDFPADLAYDKGALFLRTLEVAYGRDKFDNFLRAWFDRYAFRSVDTKTFAARVKEQLGTKVNLDPWLYEGGVPADAAPCPSATASRIEGEAADFVKTGAMPDAGGWTTMEWVVFLRALPDGIAAERVSALDAAFNLTHTANAEIAMHWLPVVVDADIQSSAPAVAAFLSTVGRLRMVMPLYRTMMAKNDFWRSLAKSTYEKAKPVYHPITRDAVGSVLTRAPDKH
jgi:aminopeptidase N